MNWLDMFGYLASLIVLISLLMSSIVKLRFIDLVGAAAFTIYALLIKSYPTAIMNLGIVAINIYFLVKIYSSKESFKIIPVEGDSQYFKQFIEFYKADIEKSMETKNLDTSKLNESFFILRNMIPAGVIVGSRYDGKTYKIDVDFVIPQYRDFKIGSYLFDENKEYFTSKGYTRIISCTTDKDHIKYLNKMGFTATAENDKSCYIKNL